MSPWSFKIFRTRVPAASVLSLVPCTQTSSSPRTVSRLGFAICELFISEGEQKKKWSVEFVVSVVVPLLLFYLERTFAHCEGHLRQEPPFDPESITFGDDVPSAPWGNTFAFRSKRSAPFLCSHRDSSPIAETKRVRGKRNRGRHKLREREKERVVCTTKESGFDRRLSHAKDYS